MCGRTALAVGPATLSQRFGVDVPDTLQPRYNIAPGEELLTVRNTAEAETTSLTWGLVPHWADEPVDGPAPINARSERITENRMFADAFAERRCLVLADGFYEWGGPERSKQPYRIERVDGAPYAYAGLWERWTCTILTTGANETVAPIHDRMPVMLQPGEEATWLDGDGPEAWNSVVTPYPDDELEAYPVSTRVNDPTNDGAALREQAPEQSGLDEFGG
ncbi:MAG: SOS response-associated peptidase [Halolamina sp.]|uniref:SOS response-associated peptidase n=1 Tax=Halolamina sp. TaxID=1940283 RepID=UPI002FC2C53D